MGAPETGPPTPSPGSVVRALPLGRLEAATGLALGAEDRAWIELREVAQGPREALAEVMTAQLVREPCCVSFSGGRDSSAVLAAATEAARREGLADPIPVTLRFPAVTSTDESRWQELVIAHLGLRNWELIEIEDELELLGPSAIGALRAHGLLWPPNSYLHVPIFERARGGSVMTGFDGDGLFADWRWSRAQAVLHGQERLERRDPARVALAFSPAWVRRRFVRPREANAAPWLTAAGRQRLLDVARTHATSEPRRWDRRIAFYRHSRYLRLTVHSLGALGRRHEVEVVHPLLDGGFLAALARAGGSAGYGDRLRAMRRLFGDLLPVDLVGRRSKAEFGAAIWRAGTRAFAEKWDGAGVDTEFVEPEILRDVWRTPSPLFGSSTLLHAAWLATQG